MDRKSLMAIKNNNRWIVICAILPFFILTACKASTAVFDKKIISQSAQMPTSCKGWEKINLKSRTQYYLAKEDQRLLVNIGAHNLRGRNLGCWN